MYGFCAHMYILHRNQICIYSCICANCVSLCCFLTQRYRLILGQCRFSSVTDSQIFEEDDSYCITWRKYSYSWWENLLLEYYIFYSKSVLTWQRIVLWSFRWLFFCLVGLKGKPRPFNVFMVFYPVILTIIVFSFQGQN